MFERKAPVTVKEWQQKSAHTATPRIYVEIKDSKLAKVHGRKSWAGLGYIIQSSTLRSLHAVLLHAVTLSISQSVGKASPC